MKLFNNKNNSKVRFHGFSEEKEYQNSKTEIIVSKRLIELICLTIILIVILIIRLGYVQLTQADNLKVKLETYGTSTFTNDAPRGEIYDRNYTKLVGNENVICVNYYAPKSITDKEITYIAKFLSKKLDIDFEPKNVNNVTERNIKDYFIIAHEKLAESLISNKELSRLKKDNPDSTDYEKAKKNLIVSKLTLDYIYQNMTHDEIEQVRFEYLMKRCKKGSVTLAEGISVEEASVIGENANVLKGIQISSGWSRQSMVDGQLSSIFGKVTTKRQGLPSEMKNELLALGYTNDSRVGTSGLEKQYEDILKATNSSYSIKYNSNGDPIVTNSINGQKGDNIRLSIDWELQTFADELITNELKACNSFNKYFEKMYFVMMDPNTGEVLVMSAKKIDKTTGEVSDISSFNYLGQVEIGSTSKAGALYTAFKENIIVPNTYFVDEPIKIKGSKEKKSYKNMGNINEVDALAWSSNVYMFRIAMKLADVNYVPNASLNVDFNKFVKTLTIIRRDFGELGLGVKTGLDVPNEGDGYKGQRSEAGLLLDACIGQYDTYTPIQLAQYTCTVANMGKKVQPHFLVESFKTNDAGNNVSTYKFKTNIQDDVSSQVEAFQQIKKGMRACVTRSDGTSHTYWSQKPYAAYCKTGTAEKYDPGDNVDHPNHLQIGYISATEDSKPIVAFASIAEREDRSSTGADSSAPIIANQVVDKYVEKYGLN